MSDLYTALEDCLQALEAGQDLETVLRRYPELANELRPLLEASLQARTVGEFSVPREAQRRGRARLLQRAAEMRESKRTPRRVIPVFPRIAITLGLVAVLVLSSTGLVSASSGALPGDHLYPVKRTWEDVQLLFVFNQQSRDVLESKFEQERLDEIDELLAKGRSSSIAFSGLVTSQQDGQWLVSAIPVSVTSITRLPTNPVTSGVPVIVTGITRSDGSVEAKTIQLLQPGAFLPPLEPSERNERESDDSNASLPTPFIVEATSTPAPQTQRQVSKTYEFSGVIESMQGTTWSINGQSVYVDQAQIDSRVTIGSVVKFDGYYDQSGKFVVTKIQLESSGDSGSSIQKNKDSGDSGGGSHEGKSGGGGSSGGEDGGGGESGDD